MLTHEERVMKFETRVTVVAIVIAVVTFILLGLTIYIESEDALSYDCSAIARRAQLPTDHCQ